MSPPGDTPGKTIGVTAYNPSRSSQKEIAERVVAMPDHARTVWNDEHPDKIVYIIEHPHGFVKIGVSSQPLRRLDTFQTGCPYGLSLLGVIETDEPFSVEASLHEKYEGEKQSGEWFNLDTRQRAHLLKLVDLGKEAVNRRYARSKEQRREITLKQQGLIG